MNTLSTPNPIKDGSYKRSRLAFFEPTKLFNARFTELFDNTWLTHTAVEFLIKNVKDYCSEKDVTNQVLLRNEFVSHGFKSNHPNLYRSCVLQSWNEHENVIIRNMLINAFAYYEAWCENMLTILGMAPDTYCSYFQYVYRTDKNWHTIYDRVMTSCSAITTNSFYDVYKQNHRFYNFALMDKWILYLRYYKECRNSFVHQNGVVTSEMVTMYEKIKDFTIADLAVKELPLSPIAPVLGEPIKLSLRNVVGFTQILQKIANTFDIEFIKTQSAEHYFVEVLRNKVNKQFLTNPQQIDKGVRSVVQSADFKTPAEISNLYVLLQQNGIMR